MAMKEYETIENFESPEYGAVTKGRLLTLDPATARAWCSAGLIRELKSKKDAAGEVKIDG